MRKMNYKVRIAAGADYVSVSFSHPLQERLQRVEGCDRFRVEVSADGEVRFIPDGYTRTWENFGADQPYITTRNASLLQRLRSAEGEYPAIYRADRYLYVRISERKPFSTRRTARGVNAVVPPVVKAAVPPTVSETVAPSVAENPVEAFLAAAVNMRDRLAAELDAVTSARSDIAREISRLKEQIDGLMAECDAKSALVAELQSQIDAVEQTISAFTGKEESHEEA